MKKLTSFTKLITGEGIRVAYTYSEIDESGQLISQNNKGNFIAVDAGLITHINAIDDFIVENKLAGD